MSGLLHVAPDVSDALARGNAVVALETAFVAHGFPGGEGGRVALEAERRVRLAGAVPATVGVIDGVVKVGLDEAELARFSESPEARKVGPRDLSACVVQGALGATTVGGTLAACRLAGIRGQAVTPFVLSRLHEASGGRTLTVNHELIAGNAALAAEVAAELARKE